MVVSELQDGREIYRTLTIARPAVPVLITARNGDLIPPDVPVVDERTIVLISFVVLERNVRTSIRIDRPLSRKYVIIYNAHS